MPSRSVRLLPLAAVLAASVLLSLQLMVPPVVGLANNGDFEKVMGYAGLRYESERPEDKYFTHIVTKFSYAPVWYRSGYLSSETVLARLARDAARPFARDGRFDLRVLGALQALLLALAIGGLVKAAGDLTWPAQLVAALLLVFVFTDVGYVAPLNSFYSQAASFVFLMLTVAVIATAVRKGGWTGGLLLAFLVCAAGLVGSKPQESLLGPLLAILALRIGRAGRERSVPRAAVWTAVTLCAFSAWYYLQTPRKVIHDLALYRTVFNELLTESTDPRADLVALDLDPALGAFAGRSAYGADAPLDNAELQRGFLDRMSYGKLLRFYLARPARLLGRLARAAPGAVRLRPGALGNFENTAPGYSPNRRTGRFALWSDLRGTLAPVAPVWLVLLLGGNLALAGLAWRRATQRGRLAYEALSVLILMAGVEYGVCTLADSLESVHRHLFTFQALCDVILIADAVWAAESIARRHEKERDPSALRASG